MSYFYLFRRSIEQYVMETDEARRQRREQVDKESEDQFVFIDNQHDRFSWTFPDNHRINPAFDLPRNVSMLAIFLKIFDDDLLTKN